MRFKDLVAGFNSPYIINLLAEQVKLYEGLIKSYSPEETISIIKREDPNCKVEYHKTEPGKMVIHLNKKSDSLKIKKVIHKIEVCGWFPTMATVVSDTRLSDKNIEKVLSAFESCKGGDLYIGVEAKYNLEITNQIIKDHKFLYHLTPTKYLEKVMKIGLTPKTRSKIANHPDRIYFGLSVKSINVLKPQFKAITKISDWAILKIDVSNFKRPGSGHLFIDPAFQGEGVFTLSNIHPSYITVEE